MSTPQMIGKKRFKVQIKHENIIRDCIKRLSPVARKVAKQMIDNNIIISDGTTKEEIEKA
jgi:hypothetical protein